MVQQTAVSWDEARKERAALTPMSYSPSRIFSGTGRPHFTTTVWLGSSAKTIVFRKYMGLKLGIRPWGLVRNRKPFAERRLGSCCRSRRLRNSTLTTGDHRQVRVFEEGGESSPARSQSNTFAGTLMTRFSRFLPGIRPNQDVSLEAADKRFPSSRSRGREKHSWPKQKRGARK